MGLIEMLVVLLLIILIAQLVLSLIPGLDRRIVGVVVLLIVLLYFFGYRGRGRMTMHERENKAVPQCTA